MAPHGGQRDTRTHPWELGSLRVNDLHTAELTMTLGEQTGATCIVNGDLDRNGLDLNRISAAHDGAPAFLLALASAVEDSIDRHGHATVVTVHGWNVVEPAIDLGIGTPRGADPRRHLERAAVSDGFLQGPLASFMAACEGVGIAATVGARYPARNRENLIQLFTRCHTHDTRPLVRRLARLHDRVDAVQLELSIALRFPGPWRERLLGIFRDPAQGLADPRATGSARGIAPLRLAEWMARRQMEFTAHSCSGVVRTGPRGGLVYLARADTPPLLFMTETQGVAREGRLRWEVERNGHVIDYAGPMIQLAEPTLFVALERGLAGASVIEVALHLAFSHDGDRGAAMRGAVRVGAAVQPLEGVAVLRGPEVEPAPADRPASDDMPHRDGGTE